MIHNFEKEDNIVKITQSSEFPVAYNITTNQIIPVQKIERILIVSDSKKQQIILDENDIKVLRKKI